MASPSDEGLPLEYSESSAKRRAPKKLQGIGLGQFKRPGVAHHFQPGSAAAIFNKHKAEQRMEAWLRGKPAETPQEKEKGKKKAKKGAKGKKGEAALATIKDAGVEGSTGDLSTGPTVAVAQMGQGKAITEDGKSHDQTKGDASAVVKPPTRKVIKIVTVDRRVQPTQGAWGQRAAENAKNAAHKAVATSYSTTPITVNIEDGELSAAVTATPKPPTREPIVPRAAATQPKTATTKTIPNKTIRKPTTDPRASKKSQAPMWSDDDDDDQDQDDTDDLPLSSQTAASTTNTPRRRTIKNSSTTKTSNPRRKSTPDQPTPQKKKEKKKRQVRFAPTASSEEGHEINNNTTTNPNPKPKTAAEEHTATHPPPTPYTTLSLPQANFHIPSPHPKPHQTPSPANPATDEDSQILSAKQQAPRNTQKKPQTPTSNIHQKPTFTHNPSSAAAKKKRAQEKQQQQQQEQEQEQPPHPPPRKKGVAQPPQPKRARATTNDDSHNDSANDSAAPVSKKAKTTAETSKSTTKGKKKKKKQDLPARKKKGVATKVKAKAKRARAVVSDDSDDDDNEDEE